MAPVILPDGTKEFDLTAKITDWEVSPGKIVKAWTYNGTVPGPTIKVDDGDKVRIVLKNELPESTVVHFHGIEVPNAMDGVPDITQPPVKPGESFTYEFVAHGPAVGMYHSHDHAEHQVPDGLAGAFLIGDEPVPPGRDRLAAGPDGAERRRRHRPDAERQVVPGHRADRREAGRLGRGQLLQRGPADPPDAPARPAAARHRQGRLPGAEPVPGRHADGRSRAAVHGARATRPSKGVWAYHCHILNHAEGDNGMFGMVTAFIVQ